MVGILSEEEAESEVEAVSEVEGLSSEDLAEIEGETADVVSIPESADEGGLFRSFNLLRTEV